jgi:acetyl esterase/lipase
MIVFAVLALAGLGVGFAARWSLLGLLDRVDGLYPAEVRQAGSDIGFGRHGLTLEVWAPKKGPEPAPVIVFFYGGSWNSGFREGYGFLGRALAAQGYVVVLPDYRKVPEVRFPRFVEDAAAAVAWTHANIGNHGGDPGRIAVSGHSAGAHIAAMLALDPKWLAAEWPDTAMRPGSPP